MQPLRIANVADPSPDRPAPFPTVTFAAPGITAATVAVRTGARPQFGGRRLVRAAIATGAIAAYAAAGVVLELDPTTYVLLGVPIALAFQVAVARRPIRAAWLREAPPMTMDRATAGLAVLLAIGPAALILGAVPAGNPVLAAFGTVSLLGAVAAAWTIRRARPGFARRTLFSTAVGVLVIGVLTVAARGLTGLALGASTVGVFAASLVQYLPAVFVIEEVLFRGILDTYVHGSDLGPDRQTTLFLSGLWGLWHLPLGFAAFGVWAVPYLLLVHVPIGYALTVAWRRTGNLAAPGIAHTVMDAFRNALLAVA